MKNKASSMWSGRFSGQTARLMREFNDSLPVDRVLFKEDISGSIAWAAALRKAKVITSSEASTIISGLEGILRKGMNGTIKFDSRDEDIHMAVERLLTEKTGDAGAKLHTGRSRNDQVVTDFRLYVIRNLKEILPEIRAFQQILLTRAKKESGVIMPGYTHLQQAQPVSMAHYWLSMFFALEREKKRIANAISATDTMPLGSGALAGSGFKVDRAALAESLGFSSVMDNSMDAVASRDFVFEACAALCSIGILMSRYAEDLIIWSSKEFGFVELDDAWSTGSSMMPQKKNPDSLELIRGKCGRLIGNLTRIAATTKGVGLTYYKDLQEDKEPFIDSAAQVLMIIKVFTRAAGTLKINPERISKDLDPALFATDLADYLVHKKIPFRQAHRITGEMVKYCSAQNIRLDQMKLSEMRQFSPVFGRDTHSIFNWNTALEHRDIAGGTGPLSIRRQIQKAEKLVCS
jgi:argininosuccinate lyase